MSTASEALAWEKSQLGHVGGGKYWQIMGYGYTDANAPFWCLCAQCACFKSIGLDVPGLPWFGCSSWYNWLRANRPDMLVSDPRPGDLVLYDWGVDDDPCDHVGMVVSDTAHTVTSYEGNTSGNSFAVRNRDRSLVRAFVRIPYDEEDEVTEKDMQRIAEMAANMTVQKLSAKNANGVSLLGVLVWGAKNKNLETRDTYQILRDIRNALGINDGQLVKASTEMNVGYEKSVIKKVADMLSAISNTLNSVKKALGIK